MIVSIWPVNSRLKCHQLLWVYLAFPWPKGESVAFWWKPTSSHWNKSQDCCQALNCMPALWMKTCGISSVTHQVTCVIFVLCSSYISSLLSLSFSWVQLCIPLQIRVVNNYNFSLNQLKKEKLLFLFNYSLYAFVKEAKKIGSTGILKTEHWERVPLICFVWYSQASTSKPQKWLLWLLLLNGTRHYWHLECRWLFPLTGEEVSWVTQLHETNCD